MTSREIHFIDPASADEHFEEPECSAEINILSFGSSPSWEDPGDPPEWEIDEIYNHEGELVPFHLPPRWRDRFEAWFNSTPLKQRVNPEWERLAALVEKAMENFDWFEAEAAEREYQAELEYDAYHGH